MSPERVAKLVARWVRFYTRDLPAPIARRRVDEIDADLLDHIAHERAEGTSERRIALRIASRMVRGLVSDAAWRSRHAREGATRSGTSVSRSVVRVALVATVILSLPLLAARFTNGVVWSLTDYVVAGALLVGTGLALDLAVSKARNNAYRAAVGVALAAGLLLVWIDLAVGVIGEPGEPANAMYLAVIAVGIAGTAVARLRPDAMARALIATALAQAVVAAIALIAGKGDVPGSSVAEIVGLNGMFVALFAGSAWLFRHAARRQADARAALDG